MDAIRRQILEEKENETNLRRKLRTVETTRGRLEGDAMVGCMLSRRTPLTTAVATPRESARTTEDRLRLGREA